METKMKYGILDFVEQEVPCENCQSKTFVLDGDGEDKYWLLCIDPFEKDCVNTRKLPKDIEVIE